MAISLASNFQLNSTLPLDSRATVVDIPGRDAMSVGVRYEGLTVYVSSEVTNYQLQGGVTNSHWVNIGSSTSTSTDVIKVADVDLSGHRVVVTTAMGVNYADNTEVSHVDLVLGVTNSAVLSGGSVIITISGELTEPSWSWSLGKVYVGQNGMLTQTLPLSGFIQIIGVATSPTTLLIAPKVPILI